MPFDNYTPTKVRAITECPQGQQPGEVFEVTADAADVLVALGAAELAPKDAPLGKSDAKRGTYNRRDLRAKP